MCYKQNQNKNNSFKILFFAIIPSQKIWIQPRFWWVCAAQLYGLAFSMSFTFRKWVPILSVHLLHYHKLVKYDYFELKVRYVLKLERMHTVSSKKKLLYFIKGQWDEYRIESGSFSIYFLTSLCIICFSYDLMS